MLVIVARTGLVPAVSPLVCLCAAILVAAGAAGAAEWSDRPGPPVTSADMLRKQPAQAQTDRRSRRQTGQEQETRAQASGPARHAAALPGRKVSGLAKAPACLPGRLKAKLQEIEQRWGPVTIISAHRPGARIRTGRPSLHATCQAVDFRPPQGTYRAVASWLKKSHAGGVGTYSGKHNHIHIDARPCELAKCYRWHN